MAEENRNTASIEDLLKNASEISRCVENKVYDIALLKIDIMDSIERDALYAGVALGLARELDSAQNEKRPRPQYAAMIKKLIDYCTENSKYLKPKGDE